MPDIALFEPEIPPNTGNIIRLSANTGFQLHLIKPLGFSLNDKLLRRAGLDYHEWADVHQHENYAAFSEIMKKHRILAFSTRGKQRYDAISYRQDDILLFGPETRGLPQQILDDLPQQYILKLPMKVNSRSLNLSNTVAVAVYECWRQLGFEGSCSQA